MIEIPKIVWMKKNVNGFDLHYQIEVLNFSKGIVTGKVIGVKNDWLKRDLDKTLTGRITNCFVRDEKGVCNWFQRDGVLKNGKAGSDL